MKITGKNGIGELLKNILQVCFYGGIIILIILPFALQLVGLHLNATAFVVYPNGTVLLVITYKFIKLFDSLKHNKPFCNENVKILKSTGIVALIGSFLWILDLIFEIVLAKTYDAMIIMVLLFLSILFFGVAVALYILAELLKQATEYKEENELTI